MRWFVRQSKKGGRVCAFIQYYKSKKCDLFLRTISEELGIKGNIFDFKEAFLDYKNKYFDIFEKEYESRFNDYRDEEM